MAELSITVPASHPQFASILALLSGSAPAALAAPLAPPAPAVAPTPPMPTNLGGEDDDSGPVNAAAPAIDASGIPHDERIHAKTKATNADGTWRKRRGVDDATVAAVEAELRARAAPPMPPVTPVAPPAMPAPIPAPVMPIPPVAAPVAPPAPPAMPVPEVPPAPPVTVPAPAAEGIDFHAFMQHLSGQMTKRDANGAPLIHADYLASITNEISTAFAPHGVAPLTAITDIAANPTMINYAVQLLQRDGRW